MERFDADGYKSPIDTELKEWLEANEPQEAPESRE